MLLGTWILAVLPAVHGCLQPAQSIKRDYLGYKRLLFVDLVSRREVEMALRALDDPEFDPSFAQNWALRTASKLGLIHLVARLLGDPRVDPSAKNCSAFKYCYSNAQPSKNSVIRGVSAGALMDGIGGKSVIMRMLLAHPKMPMLSELGLTHIPLSIMMVGRIHDMVKGGDGAGFGEYLWGRDQDFSFPAMLEWALMAAPLHSHHHLHTAILLKLLSMEILSTRYTDLPRVRASHHWIHQLYTFFKAVRSSSGCLDRDCFSQVLRSFLLHTAQSTSRLIYT
jgi:hypothetical protein